MSCDEVDIAPSSECGYLSAIAIFLVLMLEA